MNSKVIVSDPCDEVEHIYGMDNLHLICEGVYFGQQKPMSKRFSKAVQKEVDARLQDIKVIPLYKKVEQKKTKWQIVKSILNVKRLINSFQKKK